MSGSGRRAHAESRGFAAAEARLVAQLVGVALVHRLRGEEEGLAIGRHLSCRRTRRDQRREDGGSRPSVSQSDSRPRALAGLPCLHAAPAGAATETRVARRRPAQEVCRRRRQGLSWPSERAATPRIVARLAPAPRVQAAGRQRYARLRHARRRQARASAPSRLPLSMRVTDAASASTHLELMRKRGALKRDCQLAAARSGTHDRRHVQQTVRRCSEKTAAHTSLRFCSLRMVESRLRLRMRTCAGVTSISSPART